MIHCALKFFAVVLTIVALHQPVKAVEPHWPSSLTIGTASSGGTYYAYGEGLARILTRALDIPVTARPTEGPGQNILLMEAGEIPTTEEQPTGHRLPLPL